MLAIKYAREQKVPFLGICLGFQLAVVEWARNVCGITGAFTTISPPFLEDHFEMSVSLIHYTILDATSGEFDPNAANPLIIFMPEISKTHMGGTMRLGTSFEGLRHSLRVTPDSGTHRLATHRLRGWYGGVEQSPQTVRG